MPCCPTLQISHRILEAHSNLRDMALLDAKMNYIKAWQALPEYGTTYFLVKMKGSKKEVQHYTVLHNTSQDNKTQHRTVQHITGQHRTVQHRTVQHITGQHRTVQHITGQHRTVQHITGQHRTVQHFTMQHFFNLCNNCSQFICDKNLLNLVLTYYDGTP